ncbi:ectoine/hydroxyectoine ABC transporter permease subunit EhuC [Pseudactinotalea sp. Z1732]|uniref:ectoine/hydroxyectoine ABC transporter permease subunit EhuC n=1 Tax=Micrococcales TaxID=85006 RepID=UPI003C79C6A8
MQDFLDSFVSAAPRLWEGTVVTLQLSVGGAAVAFFVACLLGVAANSRFIIVRTLVRIVVEFFRGTSLVVQMFFLFFVLPMLGIEWASLTTGIIALGLNYGAYGSEVVRGSLNAVPKGQWETTTALSMSWWNKMRRVIWPQAWALMLPGFNNLLIMLIKGSSLAGFIFLQDLLFITQQVRRTMDTATAFGLSLVIYFLISLACSAVLRWMELRAQRKLGLKESKKPRTDKALAGGGAA